MAYIQALSSILRQWIVNDMIQFICMEIVKKGTKLQTQVYRMPTNTGLLLLHFQSHVDKRYKYSLLMTMVHRAHAISSTPEAFNDECARLRSIFYRLDYPLALINSSIRKFVCMTSWQPCWRSKTMKWRPCWRSVLTPCEFSSFVIEKYSIVLVITHEWLPRVRKQTIGTTHTQMTQTIWRHGRYTFALAVNYQVCTWQVP